MWQFLNSRTCICWFFSWTSFSLYAVAFDCRRHLDDIYFFRSITQVEIRWFAKSCDDLIYELLFKHFFYWERIDSLRWILTVHHNETTKATDWKKLREIDRANFWTVSRFFSSRQIHHWKCKYYMSDECYESNVNLYFFYF